MRKKKIILGILISIITITSINYIFLKSIFNNLSHYLSMTERVDANTLLVEGWLQEPALETIYSEFKKNGYENIITTGLIEDIDYYEVSVDGYLIFYPKKLILNLWNNKTKSHTIEISAMSELEGDNCAHFKVYVNDSIVSDFMADKKKRNYLVHWDGELSDIDSIMVQFDNDAAGEFGDRNLYVKEIIIDKEIKIPYQYNSVYDFSNLDGKKRITNNYNSNAELSGKILQEMGIDSSLIHAVPCKRTILNRTLTSALAVQKWLETSDIKIEGINIVSVGTHSRRTWMAYKKVLPKSYRIGIISLPDYNNVNSGLRSKIKTIRETIALIYYSIILIPYHNLPDFDTETFKITNK